MNANRKADLQRKLSLAAVPKPPAGLAERIKREIPKQLRFNAEDERRNFSRSTAFSLRVAASVLVLISSAYLGLQLLARLDQQQPAVRPTAQRPVAIRAEPQAVPLPPAAVPKLAEEQKAKKEPVRGSALRKRQAPLKNVETRTDVVAAVPPPPPPTPSNVTAAVGAAAPAVAEQSAARKAGLARDQMNEADLDRFDAELTTSPISGKQFLCVSDIVEVKDTKRVTEDVWEVTGKLKTRQLKILHVRRAEKWFDLTLNLTPWAAASGRTQFAILKAELARGGDRHAIARAAREAGLNALADSIEKP